MTGIPFPPIGELPYLLTLVLLAAQASRLGPGFARGLGLASGLALLAFGLWQVGRGMTGA